MNATPIEWRSGAARRPKCHGRGRVVSAANPTDAAITPMSSPIVLSEVNQGESSFSLGSIPWRSATTTPTASTATAAPDRTAATGAHSGHFGNSSGRRSGGSGGGGATAVSGTEATYLEYAG